MFLYLLIGCWLACGGILLLLQWSSTNPLPEWRWWYLALTAAGPVSGLALARCTRWDKRALPVVSGDGYPTRKTLATIQRWPVASYADCHRLLEFVQQAWWAASWGWTLVDPVPDTNDQVEYQISTAGWSGNEDLIQALNQNRYFWSFAFQEQRRGGHFKFRLPKERKEVPV